MSCSNRIVLLQLFILWYYMENYIKGESIKMSDEVLRKKVRLLKATGAIENYYEVAELLEMTEKGFYNWLSGYYKMGLQKKAALKAIIDELYIPE